MEAITSYHQIICGDAIEQMQAMAENSVDLIFGSPPYENRRSYNIGFNLKGQDWVDWMVGVYIESLRVCKGLVAFVVEGHQKNWRYSATPALLMADLHRSGVCLRKPPAFHRVGISGSGNQDWLRNDYEFIVCATSGGKLPWSDNTAMGHPPKWAPGGEMSHRLTDGTRRNQWGASSKSTGGERGYDGELKQAKPKPSHVFTTKAEKGPEYEPPFKANPGNVIHCNVGGGQMGSDLAHLNEAPFPEQLAEFFVRSFCPPGEIVLDPFCGSGTTLAVAAKISRKSIGIDIREAQCSLTRQRMGLFAAAERKN